jgi:hypothetical protein
MDKETGLVVEPTENAIAAALDALWENRESARRRGEAGFAHYKQINPSWTQVVKQLTG